MELLERYMCVVAKQSPIAERVRIVKEVRYLVDTKYTLDSTDDSDEIKITRILLDLGPPNKIVHQFLRQPHYIIGPGVYDAYWRILRLVFWVVSISLTISMAISVALTGYTTIFTLIINYLTAITSALAQSFLWITLVFIVFERRGIMIKIKDNWHPNMLPPVSKLGGNIPLLEPFLGLACTTIFFVLCYFTHDIVGIYYQNNNQWSVIPLFNTVTLQSYLPFFLIIFASSSAREIAKIMSGQWNYPVLFVTTSGTFISIFIFIVLLYQPMIWNPSFIDVIVDQLHTMTPIVYDWQSLRIVLISILLGIGLIDSVINIHRVYQLHHLPPFLSTIREEKL